MGRSPGLALETMAAAGALEESQVSDSQHAAPYKYLAFHRVQLSDQSRVYLDHGKSRPISSPSSRCHQLPSFSSTVPSGDHCPSWCTLLAVHHILPSYPPSDFTSLGLFWCGFGTSPLWEGRELLGGFH